MSLRSPIGKALGHGSAKDGVSHWWMQRVTAVALVPLTLWFVFSVLGLPSFEHEEVLLWVGRGWTPVGLVLLVLVLCHHSALGVQTVLEDYVHAKPAKVAALLASTFVHALLAVAGAYAVLKIAFQGL